MKNTFQTIEEKGLLIYRYYRGSYAQGTYIEGKSDKDEGGVYIDSIDALLGLPSNYTDEVSDERHDTSWYELKKFMMMLMKSNPTILESLFVDDEFVIYEHPIMTEIKKHRQEFVTKDCFNALIGYSIEQIKKARGLNKKIVQEPIKVHLKPLDFCYTTFKQGSTQIEKWLNHRHLKQKYCGLIKLPNMHNDYGVYYDFGQHMLNENWLEDKKFIKFAIEYFKPNWFIRHSLYWSIKWLMNHVTLKQYRGIVGEEDDIHIENLKGEAKIFYLRLSSIEDRDEKPICTISYNASGYTDHCKKYKEYKDWEKNRNPERFKENQEKEFDRKNLAHCVRLLHMGIEIAKTSEVHINRRGIDRDFLLNIRQGNTTYDELMAYIEEKNTEMKEAMEQSTLPEHVDSEMVNSLLIWARKEFFK